MIVHHKHILLIGISDIDALVSLEKHLLLPFLELKFVFKLGQTWIHIIISFLFMIGHHKHILLIGINDIEALVSQEKQHFLKFLELKFNFQLDKLKFT